MNKLRTKKICFLSQCRQSGSPLAKKREFMDIRLAILHKIEFIFNINPPIIYFHRARCTNELKMSINRTKCWVSIFSCLFSFFFPSEIYWIFLSLRAWTFLFSMSCKKTFRYSILPLFCAIFKHKFFCAARNNFRFRVNLMPLTICFSFVFFFLSWQNWLEIRGTSQSRSKKKKLEKSLVKNDESAMWNHKIITFLTFTKHFFHAIPVSQIISLCSFIMSNQPSSACFNALKTFWLNDSPKNMKLSIFCSFLSYHWNRSEA